MKLTRLVTITAMGAALLFAQGRGPGPRDGNPPDPQTRIQMRVGMLATMLNLTDDQKSKATAIFTNADSASDSARSSLRTARQSLSDAVKKNDAGSIDQISGTVGVLTGQLTSIESKADAAFYAILTPDQQAKYDEMPHGPGPGGPGFNGGPRGPRPQGGFRGR